MDGPVVAAAKLALKTGDVTPVLKWVRKADEPNVRVAFEHALRVRTLSPEASDMADNYFFETLVRLHRAGEGEPYTGLKPAGTEVEPGIALADKALESRSDDELVKQVTAEVARGIRQRFVRAQETRKQAEQSLKAGRQYVLMHGWSNHEHIDNIAADSPSKLSLSRQRSYVLFLSESSRYAVITLCTET